MEEFIRSVHLVGWDFLIVPAVLMAVDIATGFIGAWIAHDIKSSKLREGIGHKCGELVMLIVPDFLSRTIELPQSITTFIACYIIVMEIISIVENLDKLGIKPPRAISSKLDSVREDMEDGEEKKSE